LLPFSFTDTKKEFDMIDEFIMDAVYRLLDTELDCLDDTAFGEAIQSQAAYLAGLSCE
jgi:hypothetical protein